MRKSEDHKISDAAIPGYSRDMKGTRQKNKGRKRGKFLAPAVKSRKLNWIGIAAALLMLIATGVYTAGEFFTDKSTAHQEEIQPEETVNTAMVHYAPVLEKYRSAIAESWDPGKCAQEGISTLIAYYAQNPGQFGISFLDVDNNGSLELLITDGSVILDLYALTDGQPILVFNGWERNVYYLAEGNTIFNRGSNGAASTIYNWYSLENTSLTELQTVFFDAFADPENPWRYCKADGIQETISEDTAWEIINSTDIISDIAFAPITELP